MREVNRIRGVLEFVGEGQRIVLLIALSFSEVLVSGVGYIEPIANPFLAADLVLHLRVDHGTEPVIEKTTWLDQVEKIEFDYLALGGVLDAEEEPLCVSLCVDVILQDQVVFAVRDLVRAKQIPALKPAFELEAGGFLSIGLDQIVDVLVPDLGLRGGAVFALAANYVFNFQDVARKVEFFIEPHRLLQV